MINNAPTAVSLMRRVYKTKTNPYAQVLEGGESSDKVTLTRENAIISPSTPVAYQVGDGMMHDITDY
jgi:hypothetical protein